MDGLIVLTLSHLLDGRGVVKACIVVELLKCVIFFLFLFELLLFELNIQSKL